MGKVARSSNFDEGLKAVPRSWQFYRDERESDYTLIAIKLRLHRHFPSAKLRPASSSLATDSFEQDSV